MFTNPSTIWIEVIVLVAAIGFVAAIVGIYIYRKTHNLPTGQCACCHKSKEQLLKEYHKFCYTEQNKK